MARSNGGIIGRRNQSSFTGTTADVLTSKTSTGTVTTQSGTRQVQALIVAGGGAGGTVIGGGGGGGGYRCVTNIQVPAGSVSVTIGAGGAGTGYNAAPNRGANSSVTSICGIDVESAGGGAGATLSHNSAPIAVGGLSLIHI